MIDRPLYDELLDAAHEAVLNDALDALTACDHDRQHRSAGCPACRALASTTDWLAAHRQLEIDAVALLRGATYVAASVSAR